MILHAVLNKHISKRGVEKKKKGGRWAICDSLNKWTLD